MAVTVETVREEVGAASGDAAVTALLTRSLAQAEADVDKYIADNELVVPGDVPAVKRDEAVLVAACDAYYLATAPHGIVNEQFDAGGGEFVSTPVRISKDRLRNARPVLDLYTIPAVG